MQTIRFFSMAAVALMMGACSVEDNAVEEQAQEPANGRIRFEATIAAPDAGASTRTTYTESGTSINVAWRAKVDGGYAGDQIALLHGGIKDVATVTAVDGYGNATIQAVITGSPADDSDVTLVYPASYVNADGTPTAAATAAQLNQDGTLVYIQNNLDARLGTGKFSVSGGDATLKSSVKMRSRMAIWKLTLKDNTTTDLNATALTLTIGTTPVAVATGTAKSEWYISYPVTAIASQSLTGDLTINAVVGASSYTYKKTGGVTLENGKYYQSNPVTMAGPFTIAAYANASTDVGKLICTDGHIHAKGADAGCTADRVAVITYVGSYAETSTTYNHGLALALADASTNAKWCNQSSATCLTTRKNSVDNAKTDIAGIANANALVGSSHDHVAAKAARDYKNTVAAPAGTSGWFLPSAGQWNKMFYANGSDESSYSGLNTRLNTAGGTDAELATDSGYWSSTEYDDEKAWQWCDANTLDSNPVLGWYEKEKESSSTIHVRACIAF